MSEDRLDRIEKLIEATSRNIDNASRRMEQTLNRAVAAGFRQFARMGRDVAELQKDALLRQADWDDKLAELRESHNALIQAQMETERALKDFIERSGRKPEIPPQKDGDKEARDQ